MILKFLFYSFRVVTAIAIILTVNSVFTVIPAFYAVNQSDIANTHIFVFVFPAFLFVSIVLTIDRLLDEFIDEHSLKEASFIEMAAKSPFSWIIIKTFKIFVTGAVIVVARSIGFIVSMSIVMTLGVSIWVAIFGRYILLLTAITMLAAFQPSLSIKRMNMEKAIGRLCEVLVNMIVAVFGIIGLKGNSHAEVAHETYSSFIELSALYILLEIAWYLFFWALIVPYFMVAAFDVTLFFAWKKFITLVGVI